MAGCAKAAGRLPLACARSLLVNSSLTPQTQLVTRLPLRPGPITRSVSKVVHPVPVAPSPTLPYSREADQLMASSGVRGSFPAILAKEVELSEHSERAALRSVARAKGGGCVKCPVSYKQRQKWWRQQ